jgi:hypothetical protein
LAQVDLHEAILRELSTISQRLEHLERYVPTLDRTWLTPTEMSKLCGVTPRTLQSYVTSGRLSSPSYKREARGKTFNYRYHRELALRDLGLN